jgi:hypothetical protein
MVIALCRLSRFDAVVMDEPHLLAAARRIAVNPVVAGLVTPNSCHPNSELDPAVRTTWAGFSVGGAAAPSF